MRTTLTIRTGDPLRKRLEERAAASGLSLSELVRDILEKAVAEQPLGRRAGHLRGRLALSRDASDRWRTSVRDRNWRP